MDQMIDALQYNAWASLCLVLGLIVGMLPTKWRLKFLSSTLVNVGFFGTIVCLLRLLEFL